MLSTKSTNKIMSNPLFVIIVLLLGLIIILAIFRTAAPFLNFGLGINAHIGQLKGSFEIEAFDNQNPTFVMFYAPWCGHCKKAKPEFDKLEKTYKGKVTIISINADDKESEELVKSHNIKGYPTIRYYPTCLDNNKFTEYTGERTYSNFIQFLGSIEGYPDAMPDNGAPVDY